MPVKVVVKTQFDTTPLERGIRQETERVTDYVLRQTLTYARLNVFPGRGPGPHPHPGPREPGGWEDTGNLMWSIEPIAEARWRRSVYRGSVGTRSPYGYDLEEGWVTPTGRFVRYPWLWPAFQLAYYEGMQLLSQTFPKIVTGRIMGGPAFEQEELPF